ncbi:hypothetical protein DENIS_0690 [Desulfonema ishimotonii]|uniref:Uncharacterized protein n=1 Tax=Desulfonema ishimotonii TaxID=45657 RepID=A0A401FS00_9BACT|nr:hypothetical protein [Desulfonema ishimotonii]GBC59749.1 hypothetical protein DENIS_0690 [Desulfonema ishimotonii]
MEKQVSVAKHEKSILPGFRNKINQAESTEDVKKFFTYTIRELLVRIFEDDTYQDYDAIELSPNAAPYYKIRKDVTPPDEFSALWNNSDVQRVIADLAETAIHRYRHLEKKPEKTTTKIRN